MNASTQNRLNDSALLLLRLLLATVFIFHGSQKLFGWFGGYGIEGTAGWMASIGIPMPTLSAILAASAEFFGGLVLLIGTGTRLAIIPLAFTMAVAIITVHGSAGFSNQTGGFEYPLTLGITLIALGLMGPGQFTIARLFAPRTTAQHVGQPRIA